MRNSSPDPEDPDNHPLSSVLHKEQKCTGNIAVPILLCLLHAESIHRHVMCVFLEHSSPVTPFWLPPWKATLAVWSLITLAERGKGFPASIRKHWKLKLGYFRGYICSRKPRNHSWYKITHNILQPNSGSFGAHCMDPCTQSTSILCTSWSLPTQVMELWNLEATRYFELADLSPDEKVLPQK